MKIPAHRIVLGITSRFQKSRIPFIRPSLVCRQETGWNEAPSDEQSAEDLMQAGYCLSKTDAGPPLKSPCEFSQPGEMEAGFRQSGESLVFLVLFQQGKSTFQANQNNVLFTPGMCRRGLRHYNRAASNPEFISGTILNVFAVKNFEPLRRKGAKGIAKKSLR
ncbi:MAG: hypothetical protein WA004_05695 [Saprospiraceae bacterium]